MPWKMVRLRSSILGSWRSPIDLWYVLIRFDGLQYQINLRGGIIFSYRIRCPALFWNKPFSCRQWVWRSTVNIRDCGLFFLKLGFAPYFCMWHVLDQDFMFPRPRFCTTENKVRAYFTGKGFVASLENVRCDLERWTLESKLGGCTVMNVNIYNDVLCTKLYTCKSQKKNRSIKCCPCAHGVGISFPSQRWMWSPAKKLLEGNAIRVPELQLFLCVSATSWRLGMLFMLGGSSHES